jgi:hypothetical protein
VLASSKEFDLRIQYVCRPFDMTVVRNAEHDTPGLPIRECETLIEFYYVTNLRNAAITDRKVDSFNRHRRDQSGAPHSASNGWVSAARVEDHNQDTASFSKTWVCLAQSILRQYKPPQEL